MRLMRAGIFLAMVICAGMWAGCGQPPDKLSPQAEKFKLLVLNILDERGRELAPSLNEEQTQPGQQPGQFCQKAVGEIFLKAAKQGKPLDYNLVLMDRAAVVQAWWGPDPKKEGKPDAGPLGEDYSNYQKLDPVYQHKRLASFEAYTTNSHSFVVCSPLNYQEKFVGSICLGFDVALLKKKYDLDKKGFDSIDFND